MVSNHWQRRQNHNRTPALPQKRTSQPRSLYEAFKGKQLKGDLEKLIATLKDDDNPIIMIAKFK